MKKIPLTPAAVLLLSLCNPSSAQIYKWVDQGGQQHYTERPAPSGQKVEAIGEKIRFAADLKNKKPKPSALLATTTDSETVQPGTTAYHEYITAEKEAQDNYRQQLEDYCIAQRDNLEKLSKNTPISWEENGNTKLLSNEQKKQKQIETEKSVAKNCADKKG